MPKYSRFVPVWICGVFVLVLGGLLVRNYNTSPAGYAAVYAVVTMWMACILSVGIGAVLLAFRKARPVAKVVLVSGAILPLVFVAGVRISEWQHWVLWEDRPPHPIGPNANASEVVYFRDGVTEAEIDDFTRRSLYVERPDGGGFEFKPSIISYLRLPPQAHGHEGFAIEVSPTLSKDSRDQLGTLFVQSNLVFAVYHDIAPDEIPAP